MLAKEELSRCCPRCGKEFLFHWELLTNQRAADGTPTTLVTFICPHYLQSHPAGAARANDAAAEFATRNSH